MHTVPTRHHKKRLCPIYPCAVSSMAAVPRTLWLTQRITEARECREPPCTVQRSPSFLLHDFLHAVNQTEVRITFMAQSVNDYHSISRLLYTQRVKYDVPDHVLLGTAVLCVLFSNYSIIFNLLSDRVVLRSRVVALYG